MKMKTEQNLVCIQTNTANTSSSDVQPAPVSAIRLTAEMFIPTDQYDVTQNLLSHGGTQYYNLHYQPAPYFDKFKMTSYVNLHPGYYKVLLRTRCAPDNGLTEVLVDGVLLGTADPRPAGAYPGVLDWSITYIITETFQVLTPGKKKVVIRINGTNGTDYGILFRSLSFVQYK